MWTVLNYATFSGLTGNGDYKKAKSNLVWFMTCNSHFDLTQTSVNIFSQRRFARANQSHCGIAKQSHCKSVTLRTLTNQSHCGIDWDSYECFTHNSTNNYQRNDLH